jgi:hypothetical protein
LIEDEALVVIRRRDHYSRSDELAGFIKDEEPISVHASTNPDGVCAVPFGNFEISGARITPITSPSYRTCNDTRPKRREKPFRI